MNLFTTLLLLATPAAAQFSSAPYCQQPTPNSTGQHAQVWAQGHGLWANYIELWATDLPVSEFYFWICSQDDQAVPFVSSTLCVGPTFLRLNSAPYGIRGTGPHGTDMRVVILDDLTQGQFVTAGDTWYFQMWHRDGNSSDLTHGLEITFQ